MKREVGTGERIRNVNVNIDVRGEKKIGKRVNPGACKYAQL